MQGQAERKNFIIKSREKCAGSSRQSGEGHTLGNSSQSSALPQVTYVGTVRRTGQTGTEQGKAVQNRTKDFLKPDKKDETVLNSTKEYRSWKTVQNKTNQCKTGQKSTSHGKQDRTEQNSTVETVKISVVWHTHSVS